MSTCAVAWLFLTITSQSTGQPQIYSGSIDSSMQSCVSLKKELQQKGLEGRSYRFPRIEISGVTLRNSSLLDVRCYSCKTWRAHKPQILDELEQMHAMHEQIAREWSSEQKQ